MATLRAGREHKRLQAAVPVRLEDGTNGLTRDISPTGVFFVTDKKMEPGNSVHFTIEFDNPGGKFHLDCTGEIVRVERVDEKIGIAARITESRLERRNGTLRKQGAHV